MVEAVERLTGSWIASRCPGRRPWSRSTRADAVLQLLSRDVARATVSVAFLAPADAYPLIAPALRRPLASGVRLALCATGPVDLGFVPVLVVTADAAGWPGMPVLLSWTTARPWSRRVRAATFGGIGARRRPSSPRHGSPSSASPAHERGRRPILALQREYLAELPAMLLDIRSELDRLRRGDEGGGDLKTHFHRLAGSGGSYGFPAISTVAREAEQWLGAGPSPAEAPRLDATVTRLEEIVGEAAKGLE